MRPLLTTNIYEPEGTVLIAGTCLSRMEPEGYAQAAAMADMVYTLCLEESHINMAVTKLGAMLSTGRIQKLIYATVDRSPHCIQLHYIDHEIRRMTPLTIPTEHYVAWQGKLIFVPEAAIERSKTLRILAESEA